jgi:hypothetical protein
MVVELLHGLWGEVVEVVVGPLGVEPLHPFGGGQLDLVDVAPGALPTDEFVLERPDGGLGQGVVQRIADGADRRVHSFIDESLGERHRGVLTRFNRWTQHLDDGGVFDGTTTGMGSGVDGAGGDALTGTAAGTQGS